MITATQDTIEHDLANPERTSPRHGLILANPRARGLLAMARGRTAISALSEAVLRHGLDAQVEAVPHHGRMTERLRKAMDEGYDTIVAAGGDGTVRAIAQGLVASKLSLGILPMGTDNNFARSLGLHMELDAAMTVIRDGSELAVDVGRVGNEYFLEAAGVGLFADAMNAFGPDEPRLHEFGRIARVLGPLFWNVRPRRLTVTLDGEVVEHRAVMLTAANAAYIGAGMQMAPEARLTDGKLDVVIVGPVSRLGLLRFGFALLRGRHLELPHVRHALASQIEVKAGRDGKRRIPLHADDHIAARTPDRITVVPRALRVLVPTSGRSLES